MIFPRTNQRRRLGGVEGSTALDPGLAGPGLVSLRASLLPTHAQSAGAARSSDDEMPNLLTREWSSLGGRPTSSVCRH